ncbi:MAG: hypothetical protein ACI8PZ_006896 [Myxococcota bacterium]|jgi:hypothetical protein
MTLFLWIAWSSLAGAVEVQASSNRPVMQIANQVTETCGFPVAAEEGPVQLPEGAHVRARRTLKLEIDCTDGATVAAKRIVDAWNALPDVRERYAVSARPKGASVQVVSVLQGDRWVPTLPLLDTAVHIAAGDYAHGELREIIEHSMEQRPDVVHASLMTEVMDRPLTLDAALDSVRPLFDQMLAERNVYFWVGYDPHGQTFFVNAQHIRQSAD